MKNKIITHFKVNLDAAASVWAVKEFVRGVPEWDVVFVPASWDGKLEEGDLAVGLTAGGRGLTCRLGPSGTVESCFARIVTENASQEDQAALAPVVALVDVHALAPDGSAVGYLAPQASRYAKRLLGATGLLAVLRGLQSANPRDNAFVVETFGVILSGLLKNGRLRHRSGNRAVREADWSRILPSGRVAISDNNREPATNGILFRRGVDAIVYIDGDNLGVIRADSETTRMDNDRVRAVVEKAGEIADWYAHPTGYLFCRGSRKEPAERPSRVDPDTLAKALDASLI